MHPHLVRREIELRVNQNLRDAEGRRLVSKADTNRSHAIDRLMSSATDGIDWSMNQLRSAVKAIQTWYDQSVEPRLNAAR